jgi:uncharacterized membrane protein
MVMLMSLLLMLKQHPTKASHSKTQALTLLVLLVKLLAVAEMATAFLSSLRLHHPMTQ